MGSNWRVTGEDQEFRCSVLGKRVTARGHVHVSYRREAKCVTCAAKFDLLCLSPQGYSTSNIILINSIINLISIESP